MKKLLLISAVFFLAIVAKGQTASFDDNTYNKKKNERAPKQRKHLPHLVWCGWKSGFHWDTPGHRNKKTKSNDGK